MFCLHPKLPLAARPTRVSVARATAIRKQALPSLKDTNGPGPDSSLEASGGSEALGSKGITTVDSREGGLLQLRISCSAERVAAARKGVLEHLRSTTEFQGFRNKQKVPEDMIVRAGGGQQEFDLAVLEDVMNAAMNEVFKPYASEAIESSLMVDSKPSELLASYTAGEAFEFVTSAELGDVGLEFSQPYKGMDVEVDAVLNQKEEDLRCHRAVQLSLRKEGGKLRVANRGFQMGDTLIIDIAVRDPDTQQVVGGIEAEKHEVDTIDENNFLPDLLPTLKGKKPGDVVTITHTFPELWDPAELAGATTEVTIKIREVLEWDLPKLSLAIARKLAKNEALKSLDEFHGKVREAVRSEASSELQARIQSEILRRLAEITTIRQVPKRSFEAFARTRYEREITELVQAGQIPQEEIEKLTEQSVVEEHLQQNHEQLVGEYRTVVALDEIYEREGLEVDEELVQSQARDTLKDAKKSGATGATLRAATEYVRNEARSLSVMAFLQQHVKLNIKPLEN